MSKHYVTGDNRYYVGHKIAVDDIEVEARPSALHHYVNGMWEIDPAKVREKFKEDRAETISVMTVTTLAGNTFDADEIARGRLTSAVAGMEDADTTLWVLADNTVIDASRAELKEALRLLGVAYGQVWVPA